MKYLTILITDTHFGTHNYSMTWLKSQMRFFNDQFIPYLKTKKFEGYLIRLIHCGDVFDSRSTINSYVATTVVNLFTDICEIVDKFYIVSGNHDYYSPEVDDTDTVRLVFEQLRLKYDGVFFPIGNHKLRDSWGQEKTLFVPWYEWMKHDTLEKEVNEYKPDFIYTHADLVMGKTDIKCPNIVTGHIHTPLFKDNIKNLGSCFALTFTDNNSSRGFYEYEDGEPMKFIENKYSIRFWRFYDDEVMNIPKDIKSDDYIEIYMSKSKIAQKKYADAYARWVKKFKNIWRIPQIDESDTEEVNNIKQFEGYDIEKMTETLIPEELKDKFEKIKQYINTVKD